MTDIDMEHGEHASSSTATPKLYISDRTCNTPGVVELALKILPAFNLLSTEVVLAELFINGNPSGQKLIKGLSSDQKVTFTVPHRYWRVDQHNQSDVHEACFHITRGNLIRQASTEPTSRTKIEGKTYKVLHRLANQDLHEDDPVDNNDISERSKAEASDHESSQEEFYDAKSQFEYMPGTFPAEEELIAEDQAAAGGDPPAEDEHILPSIEIGHIASDNASPANDSFVQTDSSEVPSDFVDLTRRNASSKEQRPASKMSSSHNCKGEDMLMEDREQGMANFVATSSTENKVAKLDRAKRTIFKEDRQSIMKLATAPSSSSVIPSSPPVQGPDTEMLDDLASNAEQSGHDEIAPRQKKPMQTFGTIDGFLSSSKTAAQHGINNHDVDPDDEAENLVHNRKPLRRTSFAPAGSAPQSNNSDELAGSDDRSEVAPTSKNGSISDADETRPTASKSKTHNRDAAAKKASKTKWDASGGRVNNELRKRLADNDEKIGDRQSTLKLWHGKNFGTDSTRNAANIRLCDVVKKQVKLHNLLVTSTDANAAADLRRRLQRWVDGKVDEYESQLDAIFSTVRDAPSNDLTAAKQQANDSSAEDSNDDFALPSMNSQQQKMAAALMAQDHPVRKTTETNPRERTASAQQVQSSTSRTAVSLVNDTPENSDDEELPEFNNLFAPRLPKGSLTETLPGRNAGKSAERPKKKPRTE